MKKVIVSFADEAGKYRDGMRRLRGSLIEAAFDGDFVAYTSFKEIDSPPHKGDGAVPYAFKAHAINKAIMDHGEGLYLWLDSPIYATGSLAPIFEHIQTEGYIFFDNIGFSIGDFTSDACLDKWGISREEAFNINMTMACAYGFSTESGEAMWLMHKYIEASEDGVSYLGDWYNGNRQVSADPRVRGHRHDQSVQSILIHKNNLKLTKGQETFFAYREHQGQMPIAGSVVLWSEGIA